MVLQAYTICICLINKVQGNTLKTLPYSFKLRFRYSFFICHSFPNHSFNVLKYNVTFSLCPRSTPDEHYAILPQSNLLECSLYVQRCYCIIMELIELFVLGFMAPGQEFTVITECCGIAMEAETDVQIKSAYNQKGRGP